ncbi:MAG: threonine/serine dehydratase [Sneathiella sp.]|nr:threonine/serine dehydratase [Sneathiella sp.]
MSEFPPTFGSVCNAAETLKGHAIQTPLLESPALNDLLGCRLFLKSEMLQKTGSFKFRGAFNAISNLTKMQKENGVFAYSSGNHAQGIALAAKMMGVKATILMPEDTPAIKISNTKGYGAKVLIYDRYTESREEIGAEISRKNNLTLIKPYDNKDVISGQGTVGLEIIAQLAEHGLKADCIAAPCGGGGLLSGISLAVATDSPGTQIFAAEPEHFDDTSRSLAAGERLGNKGDHKTMCDAIMTPMPGELTFPILNQIQAQGLVVSESEVAAAVRAAYHHFKVVIEPGGAVALAAYLSGKTEIEGKIVVAVGSGGNIDPVLFARLLQEK